MARQIWHGGVAAALIGSVLAQAAVVPARAETAVQAEAPGAPDTPHAPVPLGGIPSAPLKPLTPDAPAVPVPQAMSAQCEVPASYIAAPVPLPNLTNVLTERKAIRVLAIGSSSTYGVGASARSRSYPAQLGDILQRALRGIDVEIVNRGVGGEVASTTAERLRSEVAVARPDLVLWQLGTNDALARVPVEEFDKVVRSTIAWLRENRIDLVLVGLQYTPQFARDDNYVAIRDDLFKIASDENILYVRRYNAMQFIARARNAAMISNDNLHLNDLGYRCMAEHVAQAVIANLFVRRFRPPMN